MHRGVVAIALGLVAAAGRLEGQGVPCDDGLREVTAVEFVGNSTFRDGELANSIRTTQSTFARRILRVAGQRYCLDSLAVDEDAVRIRLLYYAQGFQRARVTAAIRLVGERRATVRFTIVENEPMVVDSLTVNGLDDLPSGGERFARGLPLRVGERYARDAADATRDSLTRRLRNQGYALAEVLRNVDFDTASMRAIVWYDVIAGPRMRIDSIAVSTQAGDDRQVAISPQAVRSALGITPGSYVSQRQLEAVKRGLYLSGAYQHVDLSLDSASLSDAADTLVRVNVTLREGDMHDARASLGYGNIECLRAQANWADRAFLGGLRRLDLTARVARIGEKVPVQIANGLCVDEGVRASEVADTLDYYVSATYSQPALFGRRTLPSVTVFSEHRYNHPTYTRDVPIGLVGSIQRTVWRVPGALSYQLEYGSTSAPQAYYCAVFNVCDAPTFETLTAQRRRNAVVGLSFTRLPNDVINPTRGWGAQLELRHASRVVGSDPLFRFTRGSVDATWVRQAFDGGILVLHARAGTVLGARFSFSDQAEHFVPPQERLYAGGANSVRGYGQNELGPIVYVVQQFDTVTAPNGNVYFRADSVNQRIRSDQPTGGDNVIVANAELRLRSPLYPEFVQYALFLDAGEVWNRRRQGSGAGFGSLRYTPGFGARLLTPIGPVRIDFALKPRELPPGPAYFRPRVLDEAGRNTPVYCLSPLNTLPVNLNVTPAVQALGNCPSTFAPPVRRSLFQRLRIHFSIGQAF